MKHPRLALALTALLLGCIAVDLNVLRQATPAVVNAEERGITVDLRYQHGYSTWGPTDVYGTAVLWPLEGVATLSVHLLPRLVGGQRYVWWVLNSKTGTSMRLGTFNTSDAGDSFLNTFLTRGLPKGADTVVVSIAGTSDPLAVPASLRSLSGTMPPLSISQSSATGTVAGPGKFGRGISGSGASASNPGTAGSSPDSAKSAPYRLPAVLPMTGGAQLLHRHYH